MGFICLTNIEIISLKCSCLYAWCPNIPLPPEVPLPADKVYLLVQQSPHQTQLGLLNIKDRPGHHSNEILLEANDLVDEVTEERGGGGRVETDHHHCQETQPDSHPCYVLR